MDDHAISSHWGRKEPCSPFSLTSSLFPILFSFFASSLVFQGTQLSQGYIFTFKHAFFSPPSSLSDILMTFAGLAFHGQGTQKEHIFCAQFEIRAYSLDFNAIATCP